MEREIREFELNFSTCATWGEVYREIKQKLELPDWCGENLDALWDAVTGMMYTPAQITVSTKAKNSALLPEIKKNHFFIVRSSRRIWTNNSCRKIVGK